MTIVWSYGGGVQTAGIAVLVVEGILPRPDYILMADTSRETKTTFQYLDEVIRPYLKRVDLDVTIVGHEFSNVDLFGHNGYLLIPAFTAKGKMPTYCSGEWKRDAIRRWLRKEGVQSCTLWMGISFEERHRAKASNVQWMKHEFPLVDMAISREKCFMLVEQAGLPRPPKSCCWMCPLRNNEEWKYLKENDRDGWNKAIDMDKYIREVFDEGTEELYLHRSRVPLDQVDLDNSNGQMELFPSSCSSGHCFT